MYISMDKQSENNKKETEWINWLLNFMTTRVRTIWHQLHGSFVVANSMQDNITNQIIESD